MRDALRSRHFGQVLHAYRHEHRPVLTQARVGRWLGLTQAQVSKLERGTEPEHNLAKLVDWAQVLHVPEHLLWFRLPEQVPAVPAPVNRPVGGSFGWFGSRTRSAAPQTIGAGDIASVREMTTAFRKLDNRYGGGHARSTVSSYLVDNVVPLLRDGRHRDGVRRDLSAAVAELNQLAGWMAYDVGDTDAGRLHLRQAMRLCQEVGDSALAAEMLAGMSHHAAFYRESALATDLARAAKDTAGRTGLRTLLAESAVMEAHGLALARDSRGCVAALGEAERAFALGEDQDRPAWLGYFDRAYLSAKVAHCFRDLGRPVEAEQHARRSLEMTDGYDRGRLFNTALLSSVLADQRRVEEACEAGTIAVGMAGSVRSVRVIAYLRDVARRLAPYRTDTQVRDLFGQFAAAGVTVD
jgi:transcriptional regulator with XRE-family HTH domain